MSNFSVSVNGKSMNDAELSKHLGRNVQYIRQFFNIHRRSGQKDNDIFKDLLERLEVKEDIKLISCYRKNKKVDPTNRNPQGMWGEEGKPTNPEKAKEEYDKLVLVGKQNSPKAKCLLKMLPEETSLVVVEPNLPVKIPQGEGYDIRKIMKILTDWEFLTRLARHPKALAAIDLHVDEFDDDILELKRFLYSAQGTKLVAK